MNEEEIIQQVREMKPIKIGVEEKKPTVQLTRKGEKAYVKSARHDMQVRGSIWNVAMRLQSSDHTKHAWVTRVTGI